MKPTSFCFSISRSTTLLNTRIAFLVPLLGMKPYCAFDVSLSVSPLIRYIITLRTRFKTWLIKLIVRCLLQLDVPFTFGIVIKIDLFMCSGKQPSLYTIFSIFVSSVSPHSPGATRISVEMSLDPGAFIINIPFCANSISVAWFKIILGQYSHYMRDA